MNQIAIYAGIGENDVGKIPRLEVNGVLVLTTAQLANFYNCSLTISKKLFMTTKMILLKVSII